jgi:YegS/Rv2252/BmrU family lipid kinase
MITQTGDNDRAQSQMESKTNLRTYVVQNPVSGQVGSDVVREQIVRVMEEHQIPHEIYETTGEEKLQEVVKQAIARGFEQFIAVGGDGTIAGVASGLVNSELPLVILPSGTVNALARELQIPIGIQQSADWWVSNRQIRKIDVMQIKDRYFLLNVSVGVSASIMKDADREEINKLGVFAFVRQAFKRKSNLPAYQFQVSIDGAVTNMRATELFIANSGTLLGLKALQLDPNADLDTGRLSVCYARMRSLFDYVRIGLKLIAAPTDENKELNCTDAFKDIRIHANQPVPVQGDGEQVGTTPVTITLVPSALHIVVPGWKT